MGTVEIPPTSDPHCTSLGLPYPLRADSETSPMFCFHSKCCTTNTRFSWNDVALFHAGDTLYHIPLVVLGDRSPAEFSDTTLSYSQAASDLWRSVDYRRQDSKPWGNTSRLYSTIAIFVCLDPLSGCGRSLTMEF